MSVRSSQGGQISTKHTVCFFVISQKYLTWHLLGLHMEAVGRPCEFLLRLKGEQAFGGLVSQAGTQGGKDTRKIIRRQIRTFRDCLLYHCIELRDSSSYFLFSSPRRCLRSRSPASIPLFLCSCFLPPVWRAQIPA